MGENTVTHDFMFISSTQHLSEGVSVVAFKSLFGCRFIEAGCIEDKAYFIQRSCQGKIINFAKIQSGRGFFFLLGGSLLLVEQYIFVHRYIYKGSMSAGNHGFRSFVTGLTNYFDIQFFRNIFL